MNCIICNHKKVKGEKKLFRVSDPNRAKLFIAAYRFNQDDVFARCSIYSTAGDIFAADVLSHKLCMKNYLVKYQRSVNDLAICYQSKIDAKDILTAFESMLSEIDLTKKAYSIATCRDMVNQNIV